MYPFQTALRAGFQANVGPFWDEEVYLLNCHPAFFDAHRGVVGDAHVDGLGHGGPAGEGRSVAGRRGQVLWH